MKILVVDDSKAMRRIVIRTLRQAGYGDHDVDEAENGAKALEHVRDQGADLVLCDWNMPEMNGLELLQALRSEGCETHFGFVTSEGTPEMKQLGKDNGAEFFVTKPFTPDSLKASLSEVIT